MAPDAVDGVEMAPDAVDGVEMAPGAVDGVEMARRRGGLAATEPQPPRPGSRTASLTSQFLRYPTDRRRWLWDKSSLPWLQDKRSADDIGDLWRVHDDLYDLTEFAARHPGGRFWLDVTRGHDITELFEASHCLGTGEPERQLARCRVGAAVAPRNAPYTFLESGFYRTLKRRAAPVLRRAGTGPGRDTTVIADCCLGLFLVTGAASAVFNSKLAAAVSGAVLMLMLGVGHNFLHQRDSWRMFFLDVTFLSSAEFRISHALSHHMFPNTAFDLEVTMLEPFMFFLTHAKQPRGLADLLGFHVTILLAFFVEGVKRTQRWLRGQQRPRPENALPLLHLLLLTAVCLLAGGAADAQQQGAAVLLHAALLRALPLWALTHATASYLFLTMGLAAAHHHPKIFHDGDVPLVERDWGLRQLDAVGDRAAVCGSPLLVLTTFGDHGLHHMFPTVDHGKLAHLYSVFEGVCAEFGVQYRYFSLWEMLSGQHKQLGRTQPRKSDLMTSPERRDPDADGG